MKKFVNGILFLALIAMGGVCLTACQDEPDKYEVASGHPVVHYIRCLGTEFEDPNATEPFDITAGQLVEEATPQSVLCLVGENLRSVVEVYFNDLPAVLNSSFITDNTMIISVPKDAPKLVSDKIYLKDSEGGVTEVPFHVVISAPVIVSMDCEYAKPGTETSLQGRFFVDDPNVPLKVIFLDADEKPVEAQITNINETFSTVTFVVPETAAEGPVTVVSIYGETTSTFRYHDTRGLITNFDGATDVVPQGWNIAATYSEEGGIDGNYVQVGPAMSNGGWTEPLKLPFWCGNWNGDPMSITSGAGVPIRNIVDMTNWENMSFKMELYVPSSNPWDFVPLTIMFMNHKDAANDSWQNNKYIHNSKNGGLDLPRAMFSPWKNGGAYTTGDKWVTITIPLTDFIYNADGSVTDKKMSIESFDSFIIWPFLEVEKAPCDEFEMVFRYDNLRLVPNK